MSRNGEYQDFSNFSETSIVADIVEIFILITFAALEVTCILYFMNLQKVIFYIDN